MICFSSLWLAIVLLVFPFDILSLAANSLTSFVSRSRYFSNSIIDASNSSMVTLDMAIDKFKPIFFMIKPNKLFDEKALLLTKIEIYLCFVLTEFLDSLSSFSENRPAFGYFLHMF